MTNEDGNNTYFQYVSYCDNPAWQLDYSYFNSGILLIKSQPPIKSIFNHFKIAIDSITNEPLFSWDNTKKQMLLAAQRKTNNSKWLQT